MAKIIIHYEDQHGNSQERTTKGAVVDLPRINGNQVEATVSYEGEQAKASSNGGINPTWHVYR